MIDDRQNDNHRRENVVQMSSTLARGVSTMNSGTTRPGRRTCLSLTDIFIFLAAVVYIILLRLDERFMDAGELLIGTAF